MPMPFIVGAAVLGGALWGGKKCMDASDISDEADDINDAAEELISQSKKSYDAKCGDCAMAVERLGREKAQILAHSMDSFVREYKKLKRVELSNHFSAENIHDFLPDSPRFRDLEEASITAAGISGLAPAAAAGALAGYGAFGAVTSLGVAGTGAAISGLSGVAATNAALAYLGGGTLAAGGLGVAGGMAVLGGIAAAPIIPVLGVFAKSKAKEKYHIAQKNYAKAEQYEATCQNGISAMNAIISRADQITDLAKRLDDLFTGEIGKMTRNLRKAGTTDYKKLHPIVQNQIGITVQLAALIKGVIIDTPLLAEDGTLAPQSGEIATKVKQLTAAMGKRI